MSQQRTIAVIGSLNVDFITRTSRLPEPGETLAATSFTTGFGGKGANQAVACARLAPANIKTQMAGNVGDDIFGRDYFDGLTKEGIDVSGVRKLEGQRTGVANIIVDEGSGENRILFTANANFAFSEEPGEGGEWDLVPSEAEVEVVVFQLEIPMNVVLHNMHSARESNKHIILNPAPASMLPDFAYQDIDTLIMNETESHILSVPRDQDSSHHKLPTEQLAALFLKWGVKEAVIITLGEKGLMYATAEGEVGRVEAGKVEVVDTTAAGDTFVGAYAVKRAEVGVGGKFDVRGALEFATKAAGLSVQKVGAMDAIPYLKDL